MNRKITAALLITAAVLTNLAFTACRGTRCNAEASTADLAEVSRCRVGLACRGGRDSAGVSGSGRACRSASRGSAGDLTSELPPIAGQPRFGVNGCDLTGCGVVRNQPD